MNTTSNDVTPASISGLVNKTKVKKKIKKSAGGDSQKIVPFNPEDDVHDLRALRINDLEKDKESSDVWVVNITKSMSRHLVDVVVGPGNSQVVIIEPTWIPQNLSDKLPKDILLRDPNFRQAVNGTANSPAAIKIISAEDAEAIMKSPQAKQEADRITADFNERRNSMNSTLTNSEEVEKRKKHKPRASVVELLARLNRGSMGSDDVIAALRDDNKKGKLRVDDLRYLVETCSDQRIKQFASKRLSAIDS